VTKTEIIAMAKECGFHENVAHTVLVFHNYAQYAPSAELERFFNLAYAAGQKFEREEAASEGMVCHACAAVIRARGEK